MSNNPPSDVRLEEVAAQAAVVIEIVEAMRELPELGHRGELEAQIVDLCDELLSDWADARAIYHNTGEQSAFREQTWVNFNGLAMNDVAECLRNVGTVSTGKERQRLQIAIDQALWVHERLIEYLRLGGCPPPWGEDPDNDRWVISDLGVPTALRTRDPAGA